MKLTLTDWSIIIGYFVFALVIGVWSSKKAGESTEEYFLSGRNMPWWLLGISMVATTFSADTPNLVSDMVRKKGVVGNWKWWAFLITGMLTVFVYAKLWRRSNLMTDVEFYELRYSGAAAKFLRGFRAIYLGVFFNVIVMATVTLAAIKISEVILGMNPWTTVGFALVITLAYSMLGGLRGVILTDLVQFVISMAGAVFVAYYAISHPDVGSLSNLLTHERVVDKLHLFPKLTNWEVMIPVVIIPLAVQWWGVWYPGAEPGGGGYVVQRMLSAKDERHAMGGTLLFNVAHYALRPWPWILAALASLVIWPDLEALHAAFPGVEQGKLGHDLAYPALLTFLPTGLLGLVIASLIAAYMSTISTHLNWGSSYVVNDFYERFINPDASEKELVFVGRVSTVLLMVLAGLLATQFKNAEQVFNLMLQITAGTGAVFLLRWFWWRVNAYSELTAMIMAALVAFYFAFFTDGWEHWQQLTIGVGITTAAWVLASYITRPTDDETLFDFLQTVGVGGPGWRSVFEQAEKENIEIESAKREWDVPFGILMTFIGTVSTYAVLFATGFWIYGEVLPAVVLTVLAIAGIAALIKLWPKLEFK